MPSVKVAAGSAAASQLPNALALIALGVGAYLLVTKGFPKLGDVAGDLAGAAADKVGQGAQALGEGTGDFFKGVFTGSDPTETEVDKLRFAEAPDIYYDLDEAPFFDPFSGPSLPRTIRVVRLTDGTVIIEQEGGSNALGGPPLVTTIEKASLAQRVGGEVGGKFTGLVTEPFLGPQIGGLSIQDVFTEPFLGPQIGGPSLQDAASTVPDLLFQPFFIPKTIFSGAKSIFGKVF